MVYQSVKNTWFSNTNIYSTSMFPYDFPQPIFQQEGLCPPRPPLKIAYGSLHSYEPTIALHTVPPPMVIISPSGSIQGAMVGSHQVINCTVSTVSGVESSSVMVSWLMTGEGSGGGGVDIIMSNDRVTISSVNSNGGSNYTSSLEFIYLMEGDEGTYTCDVMILETSETNSVVIGNISSECIVYY